MPQELPTKTLCSVVALCFHEARNLRHLVKSGVLERSTWERIQSLPTKREMAWREVAPIRDLALSQKSVAALLRVFEKRFGHSLVDLELLFRNPGWRHSSRGGNAWAAIAAEAALLAAALSAADASEAEASAERLLAARHNTGDVAGKLRALDASLQASTGDA